MSRHSRRPLRPLLLLPLAGLLLAGLLLAGLLLAAPHATAQPGGDRYGDARRLMVEAVQIEVAFHGDGSGRNELSPRIVGLLQRLPRHRFMPAGAEEQAYENKGHDLGHGREMAPPWLAALMVDLLDIGPSDRVLEIGTGTGYQTALAATLAKRIYTVEPVEKLAAEARHRLEREGFDNIQFGVGDPGLGWPDAAPFDAIVVHGAMARTPQRLIAQLSDGGVLVVPLGGGASTVLTLIWKTDRGKVKSEPLIRVALGPIG